MQTWIVNKQGQITHKEGSGNKIECFIFSDKNLSVGDTVSIEGIDYLVTQRRFLSRRDSFSITIKKK